MRGPDRAKRAFEECELLLHPRAEWQTRQLALTSEGSHVLARGGKQIHSAGGHFLGFRLPEIAAIAVSTIGSGLPCNSVQCDSWEHFWRILKDTNEQVSRCPSTLLCELSDSFHVSGKGEDITLIAELASGEGLTGPLRPLPFFLTPPTTQRLYTKSVQSFIMALSDTDFVLLFSGSG